MTELAAKSKPREMPMKARRVIIAAGTVRQSPPALPRASTAIDGWKGAAEGKLRGGGSPSASACRAPTIASNYLPGAVFILATLYGRAKSSRPISATLASSPRANCPVIYAQTLTYRSRYRLVATLYLPTAWASKFKIYSPALPRNLPLIMKIT
jgi:hypothetical protein